MFPVAVIKPYFLHGNVSFLSETELYKAAVLLQNPRRLLSMEVHPNTQPSPQTNPKKTGKLTYKNQMTVGILWILYEIII